MSNNNLNTVSPGKVTPSLEFTPLEPMILMSAVPVDMNQIEATDQADFLFGTSGDDYVNAGGGDDFVMGGQGNDILLGGEGDDYLAGEAGDDQLDGGAGNDFLDGGSGNNVIRGGAGDDIILAGTGNDVIDGGADFDVIDYYLSPGGIDVDLTTGHATNGVYTTQFSNVEAVMGSQHDDIYRFSQPQEGSKFFVLGGSGNNTIDLSQFNSNQVEISNGHLRVQPGNGEFEVLFHNVSQVIFADGTQSFNAEESRWPTEYQSLVPTGFAAEFGVFGEFDDEDAVVDGPNDNDLTEDATNTGGGGLGSGGFGNSSNDPDIEEPPVNEGQTYQLNVTGAEDTTISGNALDAISNSTPQSQAITRVLAQPFHGTVSVSQDGAYSYIPNADFFGADSFEVEVLNEGRLETIFVSINVTPVSDLPRAEDDSFNMLEDAVLFGNVMLNDFDVDGDALSIEGIVEQTTHGHVTLDSEGNFRYEPAANFHGQDRFTYRLVDSQGQSSVAEVIVNVLPLNDAPVAVNDQFNGQAGVQLVGNVLSNDSDVDGDVLEVDRLLRQPSGGTIVMAANGQFSYTPIPGFSGTDSFEYVVRDGNGASAVATVTIEVAAVEFEPGDNPLGDAPTILSVQIDAGQQIALNLPVPPGVDPANVEFRLSGLPAGASLSDGLDLGNGAWRVRGDELAGLTLATNANVAGDFDVAVHTSIRSGNALIEDSFDAGELGWSIRPGIGYSTSVDGVLGPFTGTGGQQGVSRTYNIPSGVDSVVVEFDFFEGDSWDGERFMVFGNDSLLSSDRYYFATRIDGSAGYGNDGDRPFSRALPDFHRAGTAGWSDQVHRYRIEVPVVDGQIKLGFGSTLNQGLGDESWGIDNLVISANHTRSNFIDLNIAPIMDAEINNIDVAGDPAQGELRLLSNLQPTDDQRITSILISGLSDDVQLSAGQRNANGSFTLAAEELQNLRLTGSFSESFVAEIRTNYTQIRTLYVEDFENGAVGWSANTTQSSSEQLTRFLGRFNEFNDGVSAEDAIIEKTFAIGSDVNEVIIEFDQYQLGDWKGDNQFVVYINGEAVSADQLKSIARIDAAGELVLEEVENAVAEDMGFEKAADQVKRFALRVAVNGPLTIGFGANANQTLAAESWGVDNLRISYVEKSNQVDTLLIPGLEQQVGPKNLIVNGSFELFSNAKETSWGYASQSLAGWALEAGTRFEPHKPRSGISATDGNVWLDMGLSPGNLAISQQIEGVEEGKFYELSFDLADSIEDQTDGLEVYWNGEKIADFENVGGQWVTQKLRVEGGSGDGSNTLVFRGTGDENNFGVSLDNVRMFEVDALFDAAPGTGPAGDEIRLGLDLDEQQLPQDAVVTIGNLPRGAILTVGTDNGDGTWTLTSSEAEQAALRVPTSFSGQVQLEVRTQVVEDDAHNFVTNGSFEDTGNAKIADNGWRGFKSLPGWTLEAGSQMEVVDSGHRGVEATDGNNWLDMDASPGNITISQVITDLSIGQSYELSFDTINTVLGGRLDMGNGIAVFFGGEKVLEFHADQQITTSHKVTVIGGSGDGSDKLVFQGLDETPDAIGFALDNVQIRPFTVQSSQVELVVGVAEDPSNYIAPNAFDSPIESDNAVAKILSTTGDVKLMEYGLDGINFERNNTESEDVLVFAEPGRTVLERPLRVDSLVTGDGEVNLRAASREIPAGTVVESYFLHFDTPGTKTNTIEGSITFDRPIAALIFGNNELRASDFLGRDVDTMEDGERPGYARAWDEAGESITISNDGKTISFTALTNVSRDEMRIIFADEIGDGESFEPLAEEAFSLSQKVLGLTEHKVYSLTFDVADPDNSGDTVEVFWNGELVGEIKASDVRDGQYEVQVRAGSGDGSDLLELRSPKYQDGLGVDVSNIRMVDSDNLLVNGSFENLTGTVNMGWGHSGKSIQGWRLEENGTLVAQEDFENGAQGWSDNRVTETDHETLTDFLGQFGGSNGLQSVSKTFDLQGDHNYAVIEFDFLKLNSWDANNAFGHDERLNIFLNDSEVLAFTPVGNVSAGLTQLGRDGMTGVSGNVRYVITSSGQDTAMLGGDNAEWNERVYHVRLEIINPGEAVKLGFGSTLNQGINDESFGIDNVVVFGAENPNTSLNADGTFSAAGNAFEVHNPRGGVVASDGDYWLDMGGSASNVTISQQIPGLSKGQAYTVAFDVADSVHDRTDGLQVIWNGEVIAEVDGLDITMDRFEFEVEAGSGDGSDTLKFRGTGEVNNFGVSLDNVVFTEGGSPLVEPEVDSVVVSAGNVADLRIDLADHVIADKSVATVSGVPSDAVLNAGTKNADGTWTVPAGQLENLTLRTPTSFAGALALTVELDAVMETSPELIINGSFEENSLQGNNWGVFSEVKGWKASGGEGFEIQQGVAGTAADGRAKVELDSHDFGGERLGTNSSMFQEVATFPGQVYQLSFAYSARPGVPEASNGIEVLWNGQVIKSVSADGVGLRDTSWTEFNVNVEGSGEVGRLEFRAIGLEDSFGGYIDDVSLVRTTRSVASVNVDVAVADDPTNMIVNGSFENIGDRQLSNNGWLGFQALEGWKLESGQQMEVVDSGHRGVEATHGQNWLDMDASPGAISVSQNVLGVETGKIYELSFDTINTLINGRPASDNGLAVYFGGERVLEFQAGEDLTESHAIDLVGGAGDGTNKLVFVGLDSTPDGIGLALDNIRLEPSNNLIVNGSFENLTGTRTTGYGHVSSSSVQGWRLEENATLVANEDFENGASGWSNNQVTNSGNDELTSFLGRFGGSGGQQAVSKSFELSGDHKYAIVEFDFLKLDSWDANNAWGINERLNIFLNDGRVIDFTPEGNVAAGAQQLGLDGATGVSGNIRYTITSNGSDRPLSGHNFNSEWHERIYHVRLEIVNPGESLKLGFGSTLNQSIEDESFGIDNVKVFGADNPQTRLNSDGSFTAAGNAIEIHNDGQRGIAASDGEHWLDLGGSASNVTISQQVANLEAGESYVLSFDLADSSEDLTDGVEVIWNGEVLARIEGQDEAMSHYAIELIGGSGDGTDTLKFRGTGNVNNFGVSLDNVRLEKGQLELESNAGDLEASGVSFASAAMLAADVEAGSDIEVAYSGKGGLIWGDPHFICDDGGKYDVQGEPGKIYNLLSDSGLQLNATFKAWAAPGTTVIENAGLTVDDTRIQLEPYGAPTFDGMVLSPGQPITMDNVTIEFDGRNTVVKTDEYSFVFMSRTAANIPYFDIKLVPTNPFSDAVAPHGLWGLTVDADDEARHGDAGRGTQGGGAIDGVSQDGEIVRTSRGDRTSVQLYEASSLFSTQAKNAAGSQFFRFNAERGTGF